LKKNGGAAETSTYEYDLDNRLTKVTGPDQTETYTIDAAGNRKTEVVKNLANVVLANKVYSYNSREQLLSVADGANTTTYSYDGNGNQTSVKVDAAPATIYTWGPRDQLASLSTGEAFEYDSAGHRTAKTSGGNRTLYIWSGDQLMAETNTIGNSLSQVTRVGSLLLGEVRGGTAQHLDQDAFNSVIVTTLSDGTVPGRLSYRAFGQVRSLTGNVATPFRFNGYVSDGGNELSSPSRYFSVATGRFTSMDPAKMDPMNPITGNPFVGMNGNPMLMIDPDGRWAQSGHYYTTYYVAARMGYPPALAQKLAFYAQLPDQVDKLDAMGMTSRSILADISMMSGDQSTRNNAHHRRAREIIEWQQTVHTVFHVLTGRPGALETQTVQQSIEQAGDDWATVGLLIHPLGDSFSHRKANGMMYSPLIGHGADGTTPDRIQRNQKRFSEHFVALTETLAKTAKAQGIDLSGGVSAAQIREELQAVMDIDIEVPVIPSEQASWQAKRKSWRPTQWMEPYPSYLMSRERTDDELETLSLAMFKKMLAKQGLNTTYAPETLTASLGDLLLPTSEQYTLDDAVEKGPRSEETKIPFFNSGEAKAAIARAISLYKRNARNSGAPSVVVESPDKAGVERELGK